MPNEFVLGDWNAICFQCGRKKKASYLKRHWKGYYVCPEHWEPRHPRDYAQCPVVESQGANLCTLNGMSAIPDYAVPDCSIPDNVPPNGFGAGPFLP